jgi:hypothetical protein
MDPVPFFLLLLAGVWPSRACVLLDSVVICGAGESPSLI